MMYLFDKLFSLYMSQHLQGWSIVNQTSLLSHSRLSCLSITNAYVSPQSYIHSSPKPVSSKAALTSSFLFWFSLPLLILFILSAVNVNVIFVVIVTIIILMIIAHIVIIINNIIIVCVFSLY